MIIFTDIDDTIMQTTRKIKGGIDGLTVGALSHTGEIISYIDSKRKVLLDELLSKHKTIPVSARTVKSFKNLQVNFNHHAVLSFGGIIINPDKSINKEWLELIDRQSKELNQNKIFDDISNKISVLKLNTEIKRTLEGLNYHYLVLRSKNMHLEDLNLFRRIATNHLNELNLLDSFYFYETDKDFTIIPKFIKKENAVQFLLDNHYDKNDLIIGVGDHKNDLSFMNLCDFSLIPNDSTLIKLLKDKTNV